VDADARQNWGHWRKQSGQITPRVQVSSLLGINVLCFGQTNSLISLQLSGEVEGFLVICCSVSVQSITHLEMSLTECQLYFILDEVRQGEAVQYNLLSCGKW